MNKLIMLGQMDNLIVFIQLTVLSRHYTAAGGGKVIVLFENQGEQRPRIL